MFHSTFFNSINDKHQHMHFTFNNIWIFSSIDNNDAITIEIYRNPTETGTVIHSTSHLPFEHKMSAFLYYINRLTTLPITEKSKQKEWGTILTIA